MAVYDARSVTVDSDGHVANRRAVTLRRNTFAGGSLRFSSKHRPCKPLPTATKVWTGKSGPRPVVVRRNGEVVMTIFKA